MLSLLQSNPNFGISGRVVSTNSHYVHSNSTTVELEAEGTLGSGDTEQEITEAIFAQVEALRDDIQDWCRTWNSAIEKQLYADLEYQQSDEAISEWMDANDWVFDSDGHQVDRESYMPINGLDPGVRAKVIKEYADLFDRTPDQVVQALLARDLRFDKRGNRVDVTQFKSLGQLEPAVRANLLEKHRRILVDGDDFWAESTQEHWTDKLEALGFNDVEIRYSLGYSQGDGASFTAKSIDVAKYCEGMIKKRHLENQINLLVNQIME